MCGESICWTAKYYLLNACIAVCDALCGVLGLRYINLYPDLRDWLYGVYARLIGGLIMGTEKERKDTQKALLYDLRLIFSNGEKDNYTKQEIVELLDKIAMAKDQE